MNDNTDTSQNLATELFCILRRRSARGRCRIIARVHLDKNRPHSNSDREEGEEVSA